MDYLLNKITDISDDNKIEDNLFVKNIIVSKEKDKTKTKIFIPTAKWIEQLGKRLQPNY